MDDVVTTVEQWDIAKVGEVIEQGIGSAFEIAAIAFGFLLSNPLCALMVGMGFAYSSLSLIRKAMRIAKRV